jgi:hypothetical protein
MRFAKLAIAAALTIAPLGGVIAASAASAAPAAAAAAAPAAGHLVPQGCHHACS